MPGPVVLRGRPIPGGPSRSGYSLAIIGIGALGCLAGGWWSQRIGSARVAASALAVSALCCAVYPLITDGPIWVKLALLLLDTTGALNLYAPIQPYLGAVGLGLLALALVVRLRGEVSCATMDMWRRGSGTRSAGASAGLGRTGSPTPGSAGGGSSRAAATRRRRSSRWLATSASPSPSQSPGSRGGPRASRPIGATATGSSGSFRGRDGVCGQRNRFW